MLLHHSHSVSSEVIVQGLNHVPSLRIGHNERDVGLGGALAHHLHIHILLPQDPEDLHRILELPSLPCWAYAAWRNMLQ